MNKICIIGVYFGPFPNYFPLWLESCARNPKIDFLIFSDQQHSSEVPPNVRFINITLAEIRDRASRIVGFPVHLNDPYKCCDCKPLFGLVFQEYLSKYDYWGHCDFDLVFGDLSYYFEKYDLYNYDKFLTLGHLGLYRNSETVNERFKCTGTGLNYRDVYSVNKNLAFDELPGMANIYLTNDFSMFKKRIFVDIATVYHRYRIIDVYPLDEKPINYPHQIFYWENGKIYRMYEYSDELLSEEYLYIHFQKRPNYELAFEPNKYERILITNKGFIPLNRMITKEDITRYNPYHGSLYEKFERIMWRVKKGYKRRMLALREQLYGL